MQGANESIKIPFLWINMSMHESLFIKIQLVNIIEIECFIMITRLISSKDIIKEWAHKWMNKALCQQNPPRTIARQDNWLTIIEGGYCTILFQEKIFRTRIIIIIASTVLKKYLTIGKNHFFWGFILTWKIILFSKWWTIVSS